MRNFFYQLIARVIGFYVMPTDTVVEINPENSLLGKQLMRKGLKKYHVICTKNGYEALADIKQLKPDYVILNSALHYENDIESLLTNLSNHLSGKERILITYYSQLWRPFYWLFTKLGIRKSSLQTNWVTHADIENFFWLANMQSVRKEKRILCPVYVPLLSWLANKYISQMPVFNELCLLNMVCARHLKNNNHGHKPSVSVVVAARNEAGNISKIIQRLPPMGPNDELIFVEGGSTDNTFATIKKMANSYTGNLIIRYQQQTGKGKGDAVRIGFDMANNEILMILDADMTVPPEDLTRFYRAIVCNKGEFINGNRLLYPMQKKAMRFFNIVGNKFFAVAFSMVLGQPIKDTLCGTKVLTKENYNKIAAHRSFFGDFDPFGDFDLIFGAARLGLKFVEVPIHYVARTYGATNISRWKHGFILLKMLLFASNKIKFR